MKLFNALHVDPWVKFGVHGPSKLYLLKDFTKIPQYIALEHQVDANMYCSKHDQQNSNWLYALIFNLMIIVLCDFIIFTYNEICSTIFLGV